jgi:hypothetical protein
MAIIALIGLTMGQAVRLVHGPVLCPVLHDPDLEDRWRHSQPDERHVAGAGHAVLRGLRHAVRSIGRKWIILSGCVLAAASYFPLFGALTHYGNPALEAALEKAAVVVIADPASCHFQFSPSNTIRYPSSCDIAASLLSNASVAMPMRMRRPVASRASVSARPNWSPLTRA